MTDNKHGVAKLRNLVSLILDPNIPADELQAPIIEMIALFEEASMSQLNQPTGASSGTQTPNGLAISTIAAQQCTQDFRRTVTFIRGLNAAIADTRARIPKRPVRILYPGCGPFAPLAIPLMTTFPATEARFTLLDIHSEAISSVKSIVATLELTDAVANFKVIDATSYRIDSTEHPDIIVFEIMRAGLEQEPQVAIARWLLKQAPKAILLPEEIRIDLALIDPTTEFGLTSGKDLQEDNSHPRIDIASIFTLSRQTVKAWQDVSKNQLPAALVKIPHYAGQHYQLMLFTTICIYKNYILKAYDSGLTTPRVPDIEGTVCRGKTVQFLYKLGVTPQLNGTVCEPQE